MNPPPSSKKNKKDALDNFADSLLQTEEEDKKAKKEILKEGIERIEKDEKEKLNKSRIVTSKLSRLRERADLSPFVGTSGKIKSPKIRRAEFIELLAREILYIGRDEMDDKGGIISLRLLREYFTKKRKNWELRDKDIPEALEWLDKEDLIPELDKLSDEKMLIHFRPVELSKDTKKVLETATGIQVTKSDLLSMLGWNKQRLDAALQQLSNDGIAILDNEDVFFPGI